jgi:hypothetical protein
MIEIKFTGDPAETANEMRDYLRTRGGIPIDPPDDVTRSVLYEPVRSDTVHNEVYWVTLINDTHPVACTCKGFHYGIRRERAKDPRKGPGTRGFTCKHMRMAHARHKRF